MRCSCFNCCCTDSYIYFYLFFFQLQVRFEFQFLAQDETLSNALSVKEQCANTIASNLNLKNNIDDIRNLASVSSADNSVTCGSGDYDLSSAPPSYQYRCQGNRRFYNKGGELLCCK